MESFLKVKKDLSEYKEFQEKKQAELNSQILIATLATYLHGYPGLKKTLRGILYLTPKGIHFENFEQHLLKRILPEQQKRKKIYLQIPLILISRITCSQDEDFLSQLFKSLLSGARGLDIYFRTQPGRTEQRLSFQTYLEPDKICRAVNETLALSR